MKVIPKQILRHCGQRAAQRARWGTHEYSPERGRYVTYLGDRVTRSQWIAARSGNLVVSHVILADGQVVVTGFLGHWPGVSS